jgi:hypothetical protein
VEADLEDVYFCTLAGHGGRRASPPALEGAR